MAIYDFHTTDRLLGLHAGTSRRWIDGYSRGSRSYPPVIREEHTGSEDVTWGEFVETRLLSIYRRDHEIPLQRMRPAIVRLRELLAVRYPLAHAQPFVSESRELVIGVQEELNLESPLRLWVIRSGQYLLSTQADEFYRSVQFDDLGGYVTRIWPESTKTVEINPLKGFGQPVVRGVPTSVLAELYRAGDSLEMIREQYELKETELEAAIRFELAIAS